MMQAAAAPDAAADATAANTPKTAPKPKKKKKVLLPCCCCCWPACMLAARAGQSGDTHTHAHIKQAIKSGEQLEEEGWDSWECVPYQVPNARVRSLSLSRARSLSLFPPLPLSLVSRLSPSACA